MTKIGRPPKEPTEILDARIEFRLLPEEKEQLEEASGLADMKLSAWIRKRLLSIANKEIKKQSGAQRNRT